MPPTSPSIDQTWPAKTTSQTSDKKIMSFLYFNPSHGVSEKQKEQQKQTKEQKQKRKKGKRKIFTVVCKAS